VDYVVPFLGRLLRLYLIKPVSVSIYFPILTSVCLQKVFLIWTKFGLSVEADECYTMVCRMTWSKVKVMRVWKLVKMTDFKSEVCLLCQYACTRIVMDCELCAPIFLLPRSPCFNHSTNILNFFLTDFWYSSSFVVMWPSNFHHLGIFRWWHLWNGWFNRVCVWF